MSDEALARRAPADRAAFGELYRRHVNRVYRYLLARVGNVPDAQDLTAQAFLAALEGIAGYRDEGRFVAWLLRIARFKAADHFRALRPDLPLTAADHTPAAGPLPEEATIQQLQVEEVVRAMATLTPDRAEALALRVFAELTAAEIAAVMDRSEAAVKMLVHRAWRDLRQQLNPVREEERT